MAAGLGSSEERDSMDDQQIETLSGLRGIYGPLPENSLAAFRIAMEHGAGSVRVARDEAERALLWRGRKSAFGAIARIAPCRQALRLGPQRCCEAALTGDLLGAKGFHWSLGWAHPLPSPGPSRSSSEMKCCNKCVKPSTPDRLLMFVHDRRRRNDGSPSGRNDTRNHYRHSWQKGGEQPH